jgi:hypothetical protein
MLFSAYHGLVTDPVTVVQKILNGVNFIAENGEDLSHDTASQMCCRLPLQPVGRWSFGTGVEDYATEYAAWNRYYAESG